MAKVLTRTNLDMRVFVNWVLTALTALMVLMV